MNQRIENYKYDDPADPDRAEIKPKGSWIKENKMTREEAIKIVRGRGYTIDLLNILEALGLIKFEEKKSALQIIHSNLDFYEGSTQQAMKIEKELKEAGYLK